MTGGPERRRRERGGRNVSHRITPYTNRLLSTLSEPIIWANSHPDVCLCVCRHPRRLPLPPPPRCLSHVPLPDLLHALGYRRRHLWGPPSRLKMFKCLQWWVQIRCERSPSFPASSGACSESPLDAPAPPLELASSVERQENIVSELKETWCSKLTQSDR